uniref:Uncharacterized protein n=1 Tax=Nothobranchius furzeri TaxID=105023 RepID=A0A8C6L6D2_NOTFU
MEHLNVHQRRSELHESTRILDVKKYWCRGSSRRTCEVLLDSDGVTKGSYTHRSHIVDARRRGLFVKVTQLQAKDSGEYWIGIDKIYADIMTSVTLKVTKGKKTRYLGHFTNPSGAAAGALRCLV